MSSETTEITKHSFEYGSKKIVFTLLQTERKQLRIEVTPEMDVVVKAPYQRSIEDVVERVKKKASWIIKQRIFFEQFYPKLTARKYISWETFFFLWKEYLLRVQKWWCNAVSFDYNYLVVDVHETSDPSKVLQQRYLDQAKQKFHEYNKNIEKRFVHYWVSPKKIIVRKMKARRWSCSKTWNITLNTDLVQAPKWCIEYVLNHEYCHLLEFWHTKRFYELQKETMPDRSKWKNKLEKLLA